ncbi:photosystem I assembly protein Ycf3 [compost metagenome]
MHFFTPLKLLTLLIFFISYSTFSQDKVSTSSEGDRLIQNGSIEYMKGNYIGALEYYTKAELLIDQHEYKKLFTVKNTIGICYGYLSNYGEALSIYSEALKIAEDNKLIEDQINVMCNIGILYSSEYDYKSAISMYEKAMIVAYSINSDYSKTLLAINISDIYNKLGDYKKAQFYLKSVETLKKSERFEQFYKINYAESFLIEGKVSEAYQIMKQLEKDVNRDDLACYICLVELLSKIYSKQDNNDTAIAYANRGVHNATNVNDKINLYNHLSALYTKKRQYDTALKYKDSVIIAKDSVSVLINRGLFESNKVKLKVQEYQDEIKSKTEKQQKQYYIFIVSIVIVLLISFVIYRGLKHKITRQAQEKIISDKQQQIINLELDNLKNNIAEKNRKLSTKALYLSGRNELIEEVMNALSNIPEVTGNKKVAEYMKTLKGYLKSDTEWDEFISYFEQANPNFIKTLSTRHPELNSADIRFICYILMNLDIKEISTIFNITVNAATKRKRRIKEKMEIDKDDSLYEYLTKIV